MTRLAAISLALLAAACSGDPPAAAPSDGLAEASVAASDAAVATDAAVAEPAGLQSRYTSLKDCKVLESKPDEDWSVSLCQGQGGIDLKLLYADARDDVQLLRPGQKPMHLALVSLGGGGFNKLGDAVEWRGTGAGAAFKPSALIMRNAVAANPEQPERMAALLVVVDLKQGCVVALVDPKPGQNEAARAIADGPKRTCTGLGE